MTTNLQDLAIRLENNNLEDQSTGWNVPLCTREDIMGDKNFPYKLYSKITLESNKNQCESHRYIYHDKINSPEFREQLKAIGISLSTFKRHSSKLRKYTDIIELEQLENGKIVWKIKPKDKNDKNFVTVDSEKLRELINLYNDTAIKIYLILRYALFDVKQKKFIKKQITHDWLLSKLNLSSNSTKIISDCLGNFNKAGFIKVESEYINEVILNGCETQNSVKKVNYITML